jgi:hypothetical protein
MGILADALTALLPLKIRSNAVGGLTAAQDVRDYETQVIAALSNLEGRGRAATWLTGTGAPAAGLGLVGDQYRNTVNQDTYANVAGSGWTLSGNLKGANGTTPVKGIDYVDGRTPVKGTDYFDGAAGLSAYQLWQTQPGNAAGTVAQFLASLIGPIGPFGPPGPVGTVGRRQYGALNDPTQIAGLSLDVSILEYVCTGDSAGNGKGNLYARTSGTNSWVFQLNITGAATTTTAFTAIAANQYGTHPAFSNQTALNAYLLGGTTPAVTGTAPAQTVTATSATPS